MMNARARARTAIALWGSFGGKRATRTATTTTTPATTTIGLANDVKTHSIANGHGTSGNAPRVPAPVVRGPTPLPPASRNAATAADGRSNPNQRGATTAPPISTRTALGGIVPEDIDAVYHQMQHLGQKWADQHAEAEMLEEAKKCVLSTITLHYISDGETKASAEVRAYASQEYQDHIKRMVEARRKANILKIDLESTKTHLNLTRTYEATRREEMKML